MSILMTLFCGKFGKQQNLQIELYIYLAHRAPAWFRMIFTQVFDSFRSVLFANICIFIRTLIVSPPTDAPLSSYHLHTVLLTQRHYVIYDAIKAIRYSYFSGGWPIPWTVRFTIHPVLELERRAIPPNERSFSKHVIETNPEFRRVDGNQITLCGRKITSFDVHVARLTSLQETKGNDAGYTVIYGTTATLSAHNILKDNMPGNIRYSQLRKLVAARLLLTTDFLLVPYIRHVHQSN